MPVTVKPIPDNNGNLRKDAGVTTGNEVIYKVDPAKRVQIFAFATVTGNAAPAMSNDPATPADLATLVRMAADRTDDVFYELEKGAEWASLAVTSGTWTVIIREV